MPGKRARPVQALPKRVKPARPHPFQKFEFLPPRAFSNFPSPTLGEKSPARGARRGKKMKSKSDSPSWLGSVARERSSISFLDFSSSGMPAASG